MGFCGTGVSSCMLQEAWGGKRRLPRPKRCDGERREMNGRFRIFTALLLALSLSELPRQAIAMDGSGEAWGSRDPGSCNSTKLNPPPNPKQVGDLLRCKYDVDVSGELWLIENIEVKVGAGVPFVELYNTYEMENGDTGATVYPLAGSFTRVMCKTRKDIALYGGDPERNCTTFDVPVAKGVCWPTTGDGWKCLMTGSSKATRERTPPPQ